MGFGHSEGEADEDCDGEEWIYIHYAIDGCHVDARPGTRLCGGWVGSIKTYNIFMLV